MSKLASVIAGFALLPVFAFSNVASAVTYNSSLGGGNIYTAKNVTAGGVFGDPVNATCNDVLKLRVYIHNGGPLDAEGVTVKANVPSAKSTTFSSTIVVSATNSDPVSVSDTATVKSDKEATMKYLPGTAEMFNYNGGRQATVSDTVVTTGAMLPAVKSAEGTVTYPEGKVGVSTQQARYVQFQVKVECPTTPTTPETPVTPTTPKTPETPKALGTQAPAVIASTGPASTALSMLGLGSLAAAATYYVRSRRANILG